MRRMLELHTHRVATDELGEDHAALLSVLLFVLVRRAEVAGMEWEEPKDVAAYRA